MKVLVFSDVHGNKDRLEAILKEHEDAKYTISLGDSELRHKFLQEKDIIAIKGNYPFDAGFTYEHVMAIEGKRFLLTHGHKNRIKAGYEQLHLTMLEKEVDFALHGHTHIADFQNISGKYIINPGAVHRARENSVASYLTIHFQPETLRFVWHNAETHEPIREEKINH